MTAEQIKILSDFAAMLGSLGAHPDESELIFLALREITRLKERERVLADGLRAGLFLLDEPKYGPATHAQYRGLVASALELLNDTV